MTTDKLTKQKTSKKTKKIVLNGFMSQENIDTMFATKKLISESQALENEIAPNVYSNKGKAADWDSPETFKTVKRVRITIEA